MASENTTGIHRRDRALIVGALVAVALALGGAVPAATLTTGGANATATVAGPDELQRLVSDEGQPAISDEDDCSLASFRCTR
jgi:hypothetical protein